MNDTLLAAIKEAFVVCPTNVVELQTISLHHPNFSSTIYLVSDRIGRTFKLENASTQDFIPCSIRIQLPEVSDDGIQNMQLVIDNTDRKITDTLAQLQGSKDPVNVVWRTYLSNDPNTLQNNPPLVLQLTDITVVDAEVTGQCTFFDAVNKSFPSELYTRDTFPGLGN